MSLPIPPSHDMSNSPINSLLQAPELKDPIKQKEERRELEKKFFDLAAAGNVAEMKACLEQTPDLVDIRDFWDITPLHTAVQHLQTDVIRLLCKYHANIKAKDKDGKAPVHFLACQKDRKIKSDVEPSEEEFEQILQVLDARQASIKECDKYGRDLFNLAVIGQCHPLMRVLVNSWQFDPKKIPKNESSNLVSAIFEDDEESIKLLHEWGVDINGKCVVKDWYIKEKYTPFELAIVKSRSQAALALLALGCAPKGRSEKFHPIMDSIKNGLNEVVQVLLEKGHSAAIVHKSCTPYLFAQLQQQQLEEQVAKKTAEPVQTTSSSFDRGPTLEELSKDLQKSKELVEILKSYDAGISQQFLQTKLLILRFGLQGSFQIGGKNMVDQGLTTRLMPDVVFKTMHQSVKNFFQLEGSKELTQAQKDRILTALEHAKERRLDRLNWWVDADTILTPLRNHELLIAPTGWVDHAVGTVALQRQSLLFMKANRGDECQGRPGVSVYKATQPFDSKALEILGYKCTKDDFNEKIDSHLGLELLTYLPMPYQEAGDCPWTSHEGMLLGALFGSLCIDLDSIESLDAIKEKALRVYQAWEYQDRTDALHAHVTYLRSLKDPISQQDYFLLARMLIGFKGSPELKGEVQKILKDSPIDWSQVDGDGFNLMHHAAQKGDVTFLEWVVQNQFPIPLDNKDSKGSTPLHTSVSNRHVAFSTKLIQLGASVETVNNDGYNPLATSILQKDIDTFLMLLENNADYNRKGKFERTPLEIALTLNKGDQMRKFINELLARKAVVTDPMLMFNLFKA